MDARDYLIGYRLCTLFWYSSTKSTIQQVCTFLQSENIEGAKKRTMTMTMTMTMMIMMEMTKMTEMMMMNPSKLMTTSRLFHATSRSIKS
ncbi:hypothetical protein J1N35_025561 [Gossypium stocksii]|uniref:Uncharacterized protein n=1 Tax=Gossypium stocksii TaxID=47602 RepID=A0A9D3ZYD7_9ROSI|nr:hypothetical protein J1N35_025561 [Gossypium stocksii]